jgi:hypothetical protein
VFSDDRGVNAAANTEFRGQAHESRLAGGHHVSKDAVGHGFVKGAFIAK